MHVPFLKPAIRREYLKAVNDAILSGWLTRGPSTERFEKDFARYFGATSAAMVGSGTAALHAALAAAGVGKDDEVITTPLSAVQTSNAILYTGATPVFVDIDPHTGLIDLRKVEKAITKKTKAIVPVHYYGQMVDMKKLSRMAAHYNLVIIEDAAHALEARRDGVRPGQLSLAAAFSFHAAKNITAGQGGAVVSNNPAVVPFVHMFCDSGVTRIDGTRRMTVLGYKYPITSFQVALLEGQLKDVKQNHKARQKVAAMYRKGLQGVKGIELLDEHPKSVSACHLFVVKVDPGRRDDIRAILAQKGIETAVFHEPIHLEPYYRDTFGYTEGNFPHAERFGASLIGLPTYPSLTKQAQAWVIKQLRSAV